MKKRCSILWLTLLMALVSSPFIFAQDSSDDEVTNIYGLNAVYFNRNDTVLSSFLDIEIDSVMFTNYDQQGNYYSHPVTQWVYARDSVYVVPLEVTDSVLLYTPEPVYQPGVLVINEDWDPYIVEIDTLSVTFSHNIPRSMLPEKGQVVFSEIYQGLGGRIDYIEHTDAGYHCVLGCDISMRDVFKELIGSGVALDVTEDNGTNHKIVLNATKGPKRSIKKGAFEFIDPVVTIKDNRTVDDITTSGGITIESGTLIIHFANYKNKQISFNLTTHLEVEIGFPFQYKVTDDQSILHLKSFINVSLPSKFGFETHAGASEEKNSIAIVDPDKVVWPHIAIPLGYGFTIDIEPFRFFCDLTLQSSFSVDFTPYISISTECDVNLDDPNSKAMNEKKDWKFSFKDFLAGFSINAEIWFGLTPQISLCWIDKKVLAVRFGGKLGPYIGGNFSPSTYLIRLIDNSVPEKFSYDETFDINVFTAYKALYDLMKLEWGFKMQYYAKLELSNKFEAELFTYEPSPTAWESLRFAPEFGDTKITSRKPHGDFMDITLETDVTGTTFQTKGIGYALYHLEGEEYKLANKYPCQVVKSFSGTSLIDKKFSYTIKNLPVGEQYLIFPALFDVEYVDKKYEFKDIYMIAAPEQEVFIYPDITKPKILSATNNSLTIRNNLFGYKKAGYPIGVVYIDAGQVSDYVGVSDEDVDFKAIFEKKPLVVNVETLPHEERLKLVENNLGSFDYTINNLQEGHRYIVGTFMSSTLESKHPTKERLLKSAYISNANSGYTEGAGFQCDMKLLSTTMNTATLNITPHYNPQIVKSGEEVYLTVRYVRDDQYDPNNRDVWIKNVREDVVSGLGYQVTLEGLAADNTYHVIAELSLNKSGEWEDGVSLMAFSDEITVTTAKNKRGSLMQELRLRSITPGVNKATVYVSAKWNETTDEEDENYVIDYAEVGVLYSRHTSDPDKLVFKSGIHSKEATYPNDDAMYSDHRGESVPVYLKNLESGKTYYVRPYFIISDGMGRIDKNDPSILSQFDDFLMVQKGFQYGVKYGEIRALSVGPGGDVTEKFVLNSNPVVNVEDEQITFSIKDTGIADANMKLILSTLDKPIKHNSDANLKCKTKTTKKVRRRSPQSVENVEEEVREMTVDISKLKKGATYYYRIMTTDSDGSLIYTEPQEFKLGYNYNPDPTEDPEDPEDPKDDPVIDPGEYVAGEAIDLGYVDDNGNPGPLWSSVNLGSETEYGYGFYYAWGDTHYKEEYTEDTYTWPFKDFTSAQNISGTVNDAAHVRLGGDWRLPTADEFRTMLDKCAVTFVKYHDISCVLITGPNGNKIYLPAVGNHYGDRSFSYGQGGCYWTSDCPTFSPSSDMGDIKDENGNIDPKKAVFYRDAYRFHFDWNQQKHEVGPARVFFGRSIRPVKDKK